MDERLESFRDMKNHKKNDFKSFDDLEKKNSFFTERTISLNELFY